MKLICKIIFDKIIRNKKIIDLDIFTPNTSFEDIITMNVQMYTVIRLVDSAH